MRRERLNRKVNHHHKRGQAPPLLRPLALNRMTSGRSVYLVALAAGKLQNNRFYAV